MAENLAFDQLILEYPQLDNGRAGWLHVSHMGRENRGQYLTRHQNGYVRGLPTLQNVPKKVPKRAENVTKGNKLLFEVPEPLL